MVKTVLFNNCKQAKTYLALSRKTMRCFFQASTSSDKKIKRRGKLVFSITYSVHINKSAKKVEKLYFLVGSTGT